MTTSTASDVPLSVERGVSTRVIWMSLREVILADADREHRNRPRLQARQRFVERRVRGVGAVGDHDETGERQPGQLVARALERLAEMRGRAGVLQIGRLAEAIGGRREAEEAEHEALSTAP